MLNPMSHIPLYSHHDPANIWSQSYFRGPKPEVETPYPQIKTLVCIPYEWEDLGAKGRVQSDKKDFLDLYLYKNLYLIH